MPRSLLYRMWYAFLKNSARLTALMAFHFRCRGRELVPQTGGGLVLSNHQSNLDPVIIGLASDRRLNYVARDTLFRFAPFSWLAKSLDVIAIDREGTGLGGLKETLKRLKRGDMVLLFPEGTRTRDGEVQAIKPGFCAIVRRAGVPLFPVAIAGAFEAWPRQRKFPQPGPIHVEFGVPISAETIRSLTDEQLVAQVERRIRACHAEARRRRNLAVGGAQSPEKLASCRTSG